MWPGAPGLESKDTEQSIITESSVGQHSPGLRACAKHGILGMCMHIVSSVRTRFSYIKLNTVNNSGSQKVRICFPPMEITSGGRQSKQMRLLQGVKNLNSFLFCCCPAAT